MNKIVAIVGMCGSGKSVASEYLEKSLGYQKVYFGGVTMKKLQEENLEINPENEKIMREKRITDAFADIVPLKILKIDILNADGYTFYKYNFIPGKNLNRMPLRTIVKYKKRWGKQIAGFINAMHNINPEQIEDLKDGNGDGWNHNDICNNIIVNKKTMKIVGIIDWEYSGWGKLETELENCVQFSEKMRKSGIGDEIRREYEKLRAKA